MHNSIVDLDISEFKRWYPEFETCPEGRLEEFFAEACLFLDNTRNSPVRDLKVRKLLLYLLTAHMAQLFFGANGESPSGLVGRVSSATEGTVSVGVTMGNTDRGADWYNQSPYGAKFWAATLPYRTFRYLPGSSPSLYPRRYYTRWGRW